MAGNAYRLGGREALRPRRRREPRRHLPRRVRPDAAGPARPAHGTHQRRRHGRRRPARTGRGGPPGHRPRGPPPAPGGADRAGRRAGRPRAATGWSASSPAFDPAVVTMLAEVLPLLAAAARRAVGGARRARRVRQAPAEAPRRPHRGDPGCRERPAVGGEEGEASPARRSRLDERGAPGGPAPAGARRPTPAGRPARAAGPPPPRSARTPRAARPPSSRYGRRSSTPTSTSVRQPVGEDVRRDPERVAELGEARPAPARLADDEQRPLLPQHLEAPRDGAPCVLPGVVAMPPG